MKLFKTTLRDNAVTADAVVVIDVCRAFTTAAYAFNSGAEKIFLVGSIREALDLRNSHPGSLIMGEQGGRPIKEFDLWNSPYEISHTNLAGKTLIQRTTAGTQGMVAYDDSEVLLASSFVVAGATVKYVQGLSIQSVNLVMTGVHDGRGGEEDIACADYLAACLLGEDVDPAKYLGRGRKWNPEKISTDQTVLDILYHDLDYCLELDRFDFVMKAQKIGNLLVLQPVNFH